MGAGPSVPGSRTEPPGNLGAEGRNNRQFGQRLFLAEEMVKNHIHRLPAKLGVERSTQTAVIVTQHQAQDRSEANRTEPTLFAGGGWAERPRCRPHAAHT